MKTSFPCESRRRRASRGTSVSSCSSAAVAVVVATAGSLLGWLAPAPADPPLDVALLEASRRLLCWPCCDAFGVMLTRLFFCGEYTHDALRPRSAQYRQGVFPSHFTFRCLHESQALATRARTYLGDGVVSICLRALPCPWLACFVCRLSGMPDEVGGVRGVVSAAGAEPQQPCLGLGDGVVSINAMLQVNRLLPRCFRGRSINGIAGAADALVLVQEAQPRR